MILLENKVAIITGASSGIGRSAAKLFTCHGAKVVVTARCKMPRRSIAAAQLTKGTPRNELIL